MGTINFVLIGARNTGKTCLLSVLGTQCPGIATASEETTQYLKIQQKSLYKGELPQATASSIRDLYFSYTSKNHKVEFSIDDYDGGFIELLSRNDDESGDAKLQLKNRIQESEGLLFLMPFEQIQNQDALTDLELELNTITALIEEITDHNYTQLPIPVAICVTKWDRSQFYQVSDEVDKALEYIISEPVYKRSYEKLMQLFKNVSVFPISAFGRTDDGIHPIKGEIQSYKIDEPFKYCLAKLFERYDEKIAEFKATKNEVDLFKYLSDLYEDFKHHRNGEYCKAYDVLSKQYTEQLLKQIETTKATQLNEEQKEIFKAIRNKKQIAIIEKRLSRNTTKNTRKNVFKFLLGVFVFIILLSIGFIVYMWNEHTNQNSQYKQISENLLAGQQQPTKLIKNSKLFIDKWSKEPYSYYFINDFFKPKVKKTSETTERLIQKRLKKHLNDFLAGEEPSNELLSKLTRFNESVSYWINNQLVQDINDQFNQAMESYQFYLAVQEAFTKKDEISLQKYQELKKIVERQFFIWPKTKETLKQILATIEIKVMHEADNAIINKYLPLLQKSLDDLTLLTTYGVAEAQNKLDQLKPVIKKAKAVNDYKTLIKEVKIKRDPKDLKSLVIEYWNEGFTTIEHDGIANQLQIQISDFENRMLSKFPENFSSMKALNKAQSDLKAMKEKSVNEINIESKLNPFSFRYMRPENIKNQIAQKRARIAWYQNALKEGVKVNLSPQNSEDFSISCKEKQLVVTRKVDDINKFEGSEKPPKDSDQIQCEPNGNDIQIDKFHLNGHSALFHYLEPNIFSDDHKYNFSSFNIKLKETNYFKLLNERYVETNIAIKGQQIHIGFSLEDQ